MSKFNPPSVSMMTVISVAHIIGAGVPSDPYRTVTDYYQQDGAHLFRHDPCHDTYPEGAAK